MTRLLLLAALLVSACAPGSYTVRVSGFRVNAEVSWDVAEKRDANANATPATP